MFEVMDIVKAVLALGISGLFFGVVLAVASKIFAVDTDERLPQIIENLPGANCGGCGYAGCSGLANAILEGKAPVNACPVASAEMIARIAAVMGVEAEDAVRFVAHVACRGGNQAATRYRYEGLEDCLAASMVAGGPHECAWGCIGLGTCEKACPFDAIHVKDGVAVVDVDKCRHCGVCVASCPKHIISLVPYDQRVFVSCSNQDKGAVARKICEVSCIGCKICEKNCPVGAITVTNNVASIDYDKCTNCGLCAAKCPRRLITVGGKAPLAEKPEKSAPPAASTAAAKAQTEQRREAAKVAAVSSEMTSALGKLDDPDDPGDQTD